MARNIKAVFLKNEMFHIGNWIQKKAVKNGENLNKLNSHFSWMFSSVTDFGGEPFVNISEESFPIIFAGSPYSVFPRITWGLSSELKKGLAKCAKRAVTALSNNERLSY